MDATPQHAFNPTTYSAVKLDGVDSLGKLRDDLIEFYRPANSQELFAINRIALAQQTLLLVARIENGLFDVFLNEGCRSRSVPELAPHLVGGDQKIVAEHTRNALLTVGMCSVNARSKEVALFLRFQAQAERMYRRAVEEFERLRKLRPKAGAPAPTLEPPSVSVDDAASAMPRNRRPAPSASPAASASRAAPKSTSPPSRPAKIKDFTPHARSIHTGAGVPFPGAHRGRAHRRGTGGRARRGARPQRRARAGQQGDGQAARRKSARASASCSTAPSRARSGARSRASRQFAEAALRARLDAEWLDLTLPAPGPRRGHLHPITRIQRELEELFISLGFAVLDGPEVETEYHNFDALNIPADHPARDMQDTFWLEDGNLLRTHTSPVQVRGMERLGPPLRMIAPGRVFRNESVDASHEHTFYQLEGMMIDRDVSVAHLLYFMKTLLTAIFHRDVTVRLRPGYFPFVEPGFELDIQCLICGGPGCPVCKQSGWVELLPCGLVNPNVLRMSGIDPEEWNGFAFGLGLTRLVMMRYGIDDIRQLQGGDLRFLEQF